MTAYAVRVVTDARLPRTDEPWDALMDDLAAYSPALAEEPTGVGAQIAVDADSFGDAANEAIAAVEAALGRAGHPGRVLRTEVQTWESFERDLAAEPEVALPRS